MFLCLETDFFICDFLQNALHFSYLKTMEKLTKLNSFQGKNFPLSLWIEHENYKDSTIKMNW